MISLLQFFGWAGLREQWSHAKKNREEKVEERKMEEMGSWKGPGRDRHIITCLTFWCLDGRKEDE